MAPGAERALAVTTYASGRIAPTPAKTSPAAAAPPPRPQQHLDACGDDSGGSRASGPTAENGTHPSRVAGAVGGTRCDDRAPKRTDVAYLPAVATLDDARRLALALPETDEHPSYGGAPSWRVRGKAFVWERPLRVKDVAEVGEQGEVLAALVADEGVKHALIADDPDAFFTTSHFNGHASVLVRLEAISERDLQEVVREAWRLKAPKRLRDG